MKLAALFPGIGYTCDKPLMYYAGKLAAQAGYTVLPVNYGGFPRDIKGDAEKMRRAFETACEQADARLKDVDWRAYADVVFIGKSIGTAVAARYAQTRGIPARLALLTPLKETFDFTGGDAVAFHGTADPWAATAGITSACAKQGIPLWLTEGANHSLETGNVAADLRTLAETMEILRRFLSSDAAPV